MRDHVNGDEKWQLQTKEPMQLYADQGAYALYTDQGAYAAVCRPCMQGAYAAVYRPCMQGAYAAVCRASDFELHESRDANVFCAYLL